MLEASKQQWRHRQTGSPRRDRFGCAELRVALLRGNRGEPEIDVISSLPNEPHRIAMITMDIAQS